MKTRKITIGIIFTVFFIGIQNVSLGKKYEFKAKESFTKEFKMNGAKEFAFLADVSEIKIHTWKENKVKIIGKTNIECQSQDYLDKVIELFKNPITSQKNNVLKINGYSYKTFKEVHKIKMKPNKNNQLSTYQFWYELWIPQNIVLNLKSKHGIIKIDELHSEANFELYQCTMDILSFKDAVFDVKNSNLTIKQAKSAKFDVYESEINIDNMFGFTANSKYSTFNINDVKIISAGSKNDKFKINKIDFLSGSGYYSNFDVKSNLKMIDLIGYETSVTAKNVDTLKFDGKYSKFNVGDIKLVDLKKLYETNLYAGKVNSISCDEFKYGKMSVKEITKKVNFKTAYELNFSSNKISNIFKGFSGNFKYSTVKMPLPKDLDLIIDCNLQYGKITYPKSKMSIKKSIIEDSKQVFIGATSENPQCKIKIEAYESSFGF